MMKSLMLNSAASIPMLGFGTWQLTGDDCVKGVEEAIKVGYCHIDTADAYGNHLQVAEGIKNSGIQREELFLTTKVWNSKHSREGVLASGERFLKELGVDYIDLLLIHWPMKDVPVGETLSAMDELKKQGKVRAVGVSNFTGHHLDDALQSGVEIVNNQVEVHPHFKQKDLRDYFAAKNVSITAYSPLGHASVLSDPTIMDIAKKYSVSPAQVALNWVMSRGMVAIPKSSNPERIRDNFAATSWDMEEADLARIDTIPDTGRTCDPSFSDFDY